MSGHDLYSFDELEAERGEYDRLAGIDEVGRGPFAGPIVAAMCIFEDGFFLPGINDSKKLRESERLRLYYQLVKSPRVEYSVGVIDVETIDQIGIHEASLKAMEEAYRKMPIKPDGILVDGTTLPNSVKIHVPMKPIIQGDGKSARIAAASIIAKVRRDWIMKQIDSVYPGFFFKDHKGYGTKKHTEALHRYGPTAVHRKSFAPIKRLMT